MVMCNPPHQPTAPRETLDLAARLDQIAVALAWLEQLGERLAWPMRTTFALTLSADEALTNIITYGLSGEVHADERIHLDCATLPDQVVLRIEDGGPAFDPTAARPGALAESLDEAGVGGHGLRLMLHYLRDLRYARESSRNVLTLVAALQP